MPAALYALAAGAFGIGTTEFVIMGLLLEVGNDLGVTIAAWLNFLTLRRAARGRIRRVAG